MILPDPLLIVKFYTVQDFVSYIGKYIDEAPKIVLELLQVNLNANLARFPSDSQEYSDLSNCRKRLVRKINELQRLDGIAAQAGLIVRNIPFTKDYLKTRNDIKTASNWEEFVEDNYSEVLSNRYALYLLEAIAAYGSDFRDPETKFTAFDVDLYVIRDTFDGLCKMANVKNGERKEFKKFLKERHDSEGPLSGVFLVTEKDKAHKYQMEKIPLVRIEWLNEDADGIPLRDQETQQFVGTEGASKRESPELKIHLIKGVFNYITEKKGNSGFFKIPRNMTSKIKSLLQHMHLLISDFGFEFTRKHMRNPETYSKAMYYLLAHWQTGVKNRKKPMIVTWVSLQQKAGLPKHKKNKEFREDDLYTLAGLAKHFLSAEEAFAGCIDVRVQTDPLQIVFEVDPEAIAKMKMQETIKGEVESQIEKKSWKKKEQY